MGSHTLALGGTILITWPLGATLETLSKAQRSVSLHSKCMQGWEAGQLVKGLSFKHENRDSVSITHVKKSGLIMGCS